MPQECGNIPPYSKLTLVTFMVTRPPIDPVRLVREICLETLAGNKRTRWAQRFTPIQRTGYANLTDLSSLAEKVIGPIFHAENVSPIKVPPIIPSFNVQYAIRPNARDNNSMTRDNVIQTVAAVIRKDPSVGHIVDLKNYDVMILVESVKVSSFIVQLMCRMSLE
jgi:tRNA acetyltransferase TAN1